MGNRWCAIAVALGVVIGAGSEAFAQKSVAFAQTREDILRTLNYRQGSITLGDQLATIKLKQSFRFLDSTDALTFLTKIWGNPPPASKDPGILGMLLPTSVSPLSDEGFGIVVGYDPIGYVSDDDVEQIDYSELLREMQEQTREHSKQRVANGYPSIELVGWAQPPIYDKSAKKLYWAKRLRFGDASDDTLNYNIIILGRRGTLNLNVIAGMEALPSIDRQVADILSMVSFNQGNLYTEFNPSVDTAAAYGIAGLIAGGVLTKAGFLKGLLVLLLASKKLALVIFGFFAALGAAVWSKIKALFQRKRTAPA
jgi:uncharacterized membrane-anchored protein